MNLLKAYKILVGNLHSLKDTTTEEKMKTAKLCSNLKEVL